MIKHYILKLEGTILSGSILLVECKASISIYPELKVTNTFQNLCTSIFWWHQQNIMKDKLLIILFLFLLSGIFFLSDYAFHHHFFLHLAAIPLEIILAVVIVEHFISHKEKTNKKYQLFLIKSYLFRSEMKRLFICNLISLQSPEITINKIRGMTLKELKDLRSNLGDLTYKSHLHLEKVVQEY